ncbi:hypothetical protein CBR_g1203 [Chara braunii]|uniref:Peptidase A2 domain-containing protein n=1 Tax=Chara braunii TaxID=69332 RepID=A0A388KDE5_CHABU|nr:hypothetical protein CBR_g1203 [Chara braunii]|eukprot:GBG68082.1 hypothetical protein CBR_g1203 [Chara braunii]
MPEEMADGGRRLVTLDDLIDALDKRERVLSNVPKVETFHFKGDRVSDWLDLVEQALVRLADEVRFQQIMRYVLYSHHQEVGRVVEVASGSWARFRDLMLRKYRQGDGLLTMADLEAMNRDDFSTIGAVVHEFKKKARKVHGISEETQCAIFLGLLTISDVAELTSHGGGTEKLTWATIDKGEEEGSLDQVEQHQMRLQRRKRKERDATAFGTPGVKKIVTDVLAALGYDNETEASQASVAGGGNQGQGGQGNGGRGQGGRGGGGRGRGGNGGGRRGGWNGQGGQNQDGRGGQEGGQGYGRPHFDWRNATYWHCGDVGHTIRFCQRRRDDELSGLISSCMDWDIYDKWGEHIDPKTPEGIRQEALRRATVGPSAPPTMFRMWQERQESAIRVEEIVGDSEEVTQRLKAGTIREEAIVVESDDEGQEGEREPAIIILEKMEDLLEKVGRYQQKLQTRCEEALRWEANLPEVFLYDSGPEPSSGQQGCPRVATVGTGPRSGMTFRPPTSHGRVPQATRTRSQNKVGPSQEPSQAPSWAPPRKEPEPGHRKEVVEVPEEEDEDDDEEDERLRQEEDQRAELRAKTRGAWEEPEPSLPDSVPKRKKYEVRMEEGFDIERMVDKLLEGHNDLMNLKDILASAPRLRGELKGRLSRRLVPNVHLSTVLPREVEWTEAGTRMDWKCVACGQVDLVIKNQKCTGMVDTGAEMNIIREKEVVMMGIEIDRSYHGMLHDANCKAAFCGTTSNVIIEIGKVRARTCFFVMPDVDYSILLGRSFLCRTEVLIFNKHDGTMILLLCDPACGNYEVITCRNTGPGSGRNRRNLDSFTFEESENERRRLWEVPEEEDRAEVLTLSLTDVNKAMEVVSTHDMADPEAIKALREQVLENPQVEFHRITSSDLRGPSPTLPEEGEAIPLRTPLDSLEAHLDASQWGTSRLGADQSGPAQYEPAKDEPKEGPPESGSEAGPSGPEEPQTEGVITVGNDTPPPTPIPEAGREESERARTSATVAPQLAEHGTESLDTEMPTSEEPPPGLPHAEEGVNDGAPLRDARGTQAERPPRETTEEKFARVQVRLEEIYQKKVRMEAAGEVPRPPIDPPTREQRIGEAWASYEGKRNAARKRSREAGREDEKVDEARETGDLGFPAARMAIERTDREIREVAVTSFQRYSMLSDELAASRLEVEQLSTQLVEERAENQAWRSRMEAKEAEWEKRLQDMAAMVERLSATKVVDWTEQSLYGIQGKEIQELFGQEGTTGPPQQGGMGKVFLDPTEAAARREAEEGRFSFRTPTELASQQATPMTIEIPEGGLVLRPQPPVAGGGPTEESPTILLEVQEGTLTGATTSAKPGAMEGGASRLDELVAAMKLEMPSGGPQRQETPERVPEVGELRTQLGSRATGAD